MMAGICAGALGTMSALIKFFAPYVLITIGPAILLMLFSGEQMQHSTKPNAGGRNTTPRRGSHRITSGDKTLAVVTFIALFFS